VQQFAMWAPPRRVHQWHQFLLYRQQRTCKRIAFPVGILTPDWLANATYLGADTVDMRPCHVWTKSDGFIRYWADQRSGVPVRWIFFDGAQVGPWSSVMSDWCSWHGCMHAILLFAHADGSCKQIIAGTACRPPQTWGGNSASVCLHGQ